MTPDPNFKGTQLFDVDYLRNGTTKILVYCSVWAITIQYDSGYLTCSKKLTGSQLSLHTIGLRHRHGP